MKKNDPEAICRRDLEKVAATFSAGDATAIPIGGRGSVASPRSVRDRFWLWGHAVGSHDRGWGLEQASRITPVEAAFYMSIPNVIMVQYEGRPRPPLRQYALPFCALREIVWSVVWCRGSDRPEREGRGPRSGVRNSQPQWCHDGRFLQLRGGLTRCSPYNR